jgi:hypothetical protein
MLARSGAIVLAAALTVSGCGAATDERPKPADNTAALCARWKDSTQAFVGSKEQLAPEAQAYNQAIEDQYVGKQRPKAELIEIQRAYWSAAEVVPRALAAEATDPKLRDALSAYADELRDRAAGKLPETGDAMGSPGLMTLRSLCSPAS